MRDKTKWGERVSKIGNKLESILGVEMDEKTNGAANGASEHPYKNGSLKLSKPVFSGFLGFERSKINLNSSFRPTARNNGDLYEWADNSSQVRCHITGTKGNW